MSRAVVYSGTLARIYYLRRIREVETLCEEAQRVGIAEAPPELAELGWGLGMVLWLLERARMAEWLDIKPEAR